MAAVGESWPSTITPPPVKNFAIATFGSHDKMALVIGILVVLAVLAAGIGVAAMRRLSYGMLGLAVFAVIGLAAALTRPTAEAGGRAAHADRRAAGGVALPAGPGGRAGDRRAGARVPTWRGPPCHPGGRRSSRCPRPPDRPKLPSR